MTAVDRERGRIRDDDAGVEASARRLARRESRFYAARGLRVLTPWYRPHPRPMQPPTRRVLESLDGQPRLRLITHERNRGKGAALRTGFAAAGGQAVLVQDADLEYDPADYPRLLAPLLDGRADVVFGSRFAGGQTHRVLYFWHAAGNRLLTLLSNMLTNLNLTDMECGYKVFRRSVLERITIREDRFGVEPELTAKVARLRVPIYEVGIAYHGRTYEEGKKIGWRDGLRALWCIAKYGLGPAGA